MVAWVSGSWPSPDSLGSYYWVGPGGREAAPMTEVSAMFSFSLRGPGPAIMLDAYLVGNALCWLLRKCFHLARGFYVVAAILEW